MLKAHTPHIAKLANDYIESRFSSWEDAAKFYDVDAVFIADIVCGVKYPSNKILYDMRRWEEGTLQP